MAWLTGTLLSVLDIFPDSRLLNGLKINVELYFEMGGAESTKFRDLLLLNYNLECYYILLIEI